MNDLRPCADCGALRYYSDDSGWYHHLNADAPACGLTSDDPAFGPNDEPSSNAFVREQQLMRLIRRWHEEDCIPDEALAEAEAILRGARGNG